MATEVTCIVDPDSGAGAHYSSLAAAVAGETGASPQVVANKDLTTGDEQLTVKCRCTGGTADGAVTVNGFTTDTTRFIKIWTDPSEAYRWNNSARGADRNKYPTSGNYYRIEGSDATLLAINDEYVRVSGIAFGLAVTANNSGRCIEVNSVDSVNNGIYIDGCIFKAVSMAGTGSGLGIYCVASGKLRVWNCVAYGFVSGTDTGFRGFSALSCSYMYLFNCTAYGCYYGFHRTAGTVTADNCISFGNADDFNGTITITNCASDDGDGTNAVNISPGATESTDWAEVFTDYANGDFSLKNFTGTQKVIGMGVDDPGSGLYSDDILGNARSSTWDIGAFEYVSVAPPATGAPQLMMMGMG